MIACHLSVMFEIGATCSKTIQPVSSRAREKITISWLRFLFLSRFDFCDTMGKTSENESSSTVSEICKEHTAFIFRDPLPNFFFLLLLFFFFFLICGEILFFSNTAMKSNLFYPCYSKSLITEFVFQLEFITSMADFLCSLSNPQERVSYFDSFPRLLFLLSNVQVMVAHWIALDFMYYVSGSLLAYIRFLYLKLCM